MKLNIGKTQSNFYSKIKTFKKNSYNLKNWHAQVYNRYDTSFLPKTKLKNNKKIRFILPFKVSFRIPGPTLKTLAFANLKNFWGVWLPTTTYIPSNLYLKFLEAWVCIGGLITTKLQYKGKSFKWHRKKNALVLRFGHSHLVFNPLFQGLRFKKKGRMRLIVFGSSLFDLSFWVAEAKRWRPMNAYHGRGLRFGKQVFFKKPGKVSAYR